MIYIEHTYKEFIDNILHSRGRFNCGDKYHERHHIKPKCMGGDNSEENLIDLYAREHFIAHKLLAIENPDNVSLTQAYGAMAFMVDASNGKRYECSPEEYENARIMLSETLHKLYSDPKNHPSYGKKVSDETRLRQSIAAKNRMKDPTNNPMYGKKGKDNPNFGRKASDEFRKKTSDRMKINNYMKGRYGDKNPRAKEVVRLSDGKVYSCGIDAAKDNNIVYSTFRAMCRKKNKFAYSCDMI